MANLQQTLLCVTLVAFGTGCSAASFDRPLPSGQGRRLEGTALTSALWVGLAEELRAEGLQPGCQVELLQDGPRATTDGQFDPETAQFDPETAQFGELISIADCQDLTPLDPALHDAALHDASLNNVTAAADVILRVTPTLTLGNTEYALLPYGHMGRYEPLHLASAAELLADVAFPSEPDRVLAHFADTVMGLQRRPHVWPLIEGPAVDNGTTTLWVHARNSSPATASSLRAALANESNNPIPAALLGFGPSVDPTQLPHALCTEQTPKPLHCEIADSALELNPLIAAALALAEASKEKDIRGFLLVLSLEIVSGKAERFKTLATRIWNWRSARRTLQLFEQLGSLKPSVHEFAEATLRAFPYDPDGNALRLAGLRAVGEGIDHLPDSLKNWIARVIGTRSTKGQVPDMRSPSAPGEVVNKSGGVRWVGEEVNGPPLLFQAHPASHIIKEPGGVRLDANSSSLVVSPSGDNWMVRITQPAPELVKDAPFLQTRLQSDSGVMDLLFDSEGNVL